ncbi:hypothetical protein N7526_004108 [Penicillium atrosanguineum]|nr:hypothetical protein N7526_004108 [Penicillium atrosanguineum]
MADKYEKDEIASADHEVDRPSLDHGAVEQLQLPSYQFSPEAERRLVRKIDLTILPIMLVAYMMAFLDKQTLNYTSLMGIREELHLVGSQYSWVSGMFYFGYMFFSYPASLLMVKFPLGKYLAANLLSSLGDRSSLSCGNNQLHNNNGDQILPRMHRGQPLPGFTLVTSLWYRTSEQPLRAGIWFCGNSLSLIIGNLIAVGILQIHSSLYAWQWLFIIFGIFTFLWGIVMLFRLPDSPIDAKFLNEEERMIAIERLKANKTGFKNNQINRGQIAEAFVDPKTWILAVLILASNIPNGGFTTFNGLVLEGFGFSTFHTLLLGIPGGVIVFIFVLGGGMITSKVANSRCLAMIGMNTISIIGSALVYAGHSVGARYAGLLLMGVYSAAMPVSLAMISSNVGGFTKKATVSSIYFIMYCAGNIIGPQLFFAREAPKYQSGFLAIIICLVICVVDGFVLLLYLRWENRRREKKASNNDPAVEQEKTGITTQRELVDTTDLKNREFRYVY